MKKLSKRVFGFVLSLALVAGMLPMSALATETVYVAQVGETQFETLQEAISAAQSGETAAVELLTGLDLANATLDLDRAYLRISGNDGITIENGTITGAHAQQVIYTSGKLHLENVKVVGENSQYAVFAQGDADKAADLTVNGGTYTGKDYGIYGKEAEISLGAFLDENADSGEKQSLLPEVTGSKKSFLLEKSMIEVLCDLSDKSYSVECRTPGEFAHSSEYNVTADVAEKWFVCDGAVFTDGELRTWSIPNASIEGTVTFDQVSFVYDKQAHQPTVTVRLNDVTLEQGTDYTVTYKLGETVVAEMVNAGEYTAIVTAIEPYVGTVEQKITITHAELKIVFATAENKEYDGKSDVTITAVKLQGICDGDTVSVDSTKVKGMLPSMSVGTHDKVSLSDLVLVGDAAGNYTLSETAENVATEVVITKKTLPKEELQLIIPESEYSYTGEEIRPTVTVKHGETEIPADAYTVTYSDNVNVGTATVTVESLGGYDFENLTATFAITKAAAAALTVGGQPAKVVYGNQPFKLSASGGISGAAVTWSVTEGSEIASVAADGTVTISGAGKVTVKASQSGDANYNEQSAEVSFEVKPAELTVASVTVADKTYDGKKTVAIKTVALNGIVNSDEVSVKVNEGKAELADSKAGVYNKVTVSNLVLTGADAKNYTLMQPTEAISASVTVTKAAVPAALKDITETVGVDTADLVIENLGKEMPADAGKLTYEFFNQSTSSGAKVVVLDKKVDENGKLTSKLAGGMAGEQVIYEVTVSSDNYKDTVVKVVVTLGSLALEASDVTVTPSAAELTYDGKEQKPSVEVKYGTAVLVSGTDYDVTYPSDTVNAGEKELTVQFKGNYSGSVTAKYAITKAKVSVSGVKAQDKTYDGTTKATVSATLSGVVSGDDVKVDAVGTFADKNSGSNKTINVTYTLSGDDAGNYELTANSGTTTAKITPITASSLNSSISGLSANNADSGNKGTLQNVVSRANNALQDGGLSSAERSNLTNVKYTAEDMIDRIESASAAAYTDSIRKSAEITGETVKTEDKALLQKAQSDINNALSTYSGNYTKAEETALEQKREQIAGALNIITRVESAQALIDALPDAVTAETVVDSKLKTALEDAQTAFASLNDYEKSLLGEDAQLKLTAVAQALEDVLPTDDAAKDEVENLTTASPEDGEGFKFPTWILVVAVIAAAACGGGLFLYKRKQEEETMNW